MNKLILLVCFIVVTPLVLFINIIFLSYLSFHKNQGQASIFSLATKQPVSFAALPSVKSIIKGDVFTVNARVEMLKQFFAKYNSPLEPYAKDVVNAADLYGLDYRLIPAIAMQESNLCKKIPKDSHNCWGFGIYGKKTTTFNSYQQAITTVTKTLAKEYKAKGLETPEEIMSKYTPSNNGDWARSVSYFMGILQ